MCTDWSSTLTAEKNWKDNLQVNIYSKEFANYTIELFKDDFLWNSIRNNLLDLRGSKNWLTASQNFLKQII